eukprot:2452613-Prymnesium_polylepis.1
MPSCVALTRRPRPCSRPALKAIMVTPPSPQLLKRCRTSFQRAVSAARTPAVRGSISASASSDASASTLSLEVAATAMDLPPHETIRP